MKLHNIWVTRQLLAQVSFPKDRINFVILEDMVLFQYFQRVLDSIVFLLHQLYLSIGAFANVANCDKHISRDIFGLTGWFDFLRFSLHFRNFPELNLVKILFSLNFIWVELLLFLLLTWELLALFFFYHSSL